MTGFTPGPWREGITGSNRVYGPDGAGEHSGLVAVVHKGRANLRLIAAAPELYGLGGRASALLKAMVLDLPGLLEDAGLSDEEHICDEAEALAAEIDAALAKARGE